MVLAAYCTRLGRAGILTLSDLTVRVPRRRQWWKAIRGLGQTSARQIETFFAAHPKLTERARALIVATERSPIVPWEVLQVPDAVDGSRGTFRAPRETCTLDASNDYEAVQAWLSLHESAATQRAYRKEAERLILWAIVERQRALSSLTTEDAVAYRNFLRRPTPASRWVGPPKARHSPGWRPFNGGLSARSVAYALNVIGALFRWLIEQRYLLANPFAGIKVRGAGRTGALDSSRAFTEGEWALVRTIADGLEWSYGWEESAARRLRFVLDFAYSTGLRVSELVSARLGDIDATEDGNWWLRVFGKGGKTAKVVIPPIGKRAMELQLIQRGLSVNHARWDRRACLVGNLEGEEGITGTRLWAIVRRFFVTASNVIQPEQPAITDKLRHASPHWMRHTHATHALARGAELTTIRDNLRHASIATTSIYLHSDHVKRAQQLAAVFAGSN
jgi:site-specific recombinase XerD